ncbi:hypothetical protein [Streptomyces sp. NPDC048332]|uniref:hypothetical protein n=1 Tax=Streptomyces sp. NPDC048332 TaxID=3154619 RepID=UPI00343D96E6
MARGLVAVQGRLPRQSFVSLLHMDCRGFARTAIPLAALVLLRKPETRDRFALPVVRRERRGPFRTERMILRRRDLNRTASREEGRRNHG